MEACEALHVVLQQFVSQLIGLLGHNSKQKMYTFYACRGVYVCVFKVCFVGTLDVSCLNSMPYCDIL